MSYAIYDKPIPQDKRAEMNERILLEIDSEHGTISREAIYNGYTGIGGLHGLQQADFSSYNDYALAKREMEMGQFFTPHELCRRMVEIAAPQTQESVLYMCCGIANFFNFLPNLCNAHGFDVDPNAIKVARHLYPQANLSVCDIERYDPDTMFDIVIGNPPFNIKIGGMLSQRFYCNKAFKVIRPGGLLLLIVPRSFMQDEFWNKRQINFMNDDFSFIGQTSMPSNTFRSVGVENFDTKIMAFMRYSANIEMREYRDDEFISIEQLGERIKQYRETKRNLRLKLLRETNVISKCEEERFEYLSAKYFFEIKTHPHLRDKHQQSIALITKFRNQKPPENCSKEEREEW